MRDILLSIHIIGAAAFIGGGAYSLAVFPGNVKEIGIKAALARDEAMGNKFFGTAVGILLLSGILLVLDSDVYGWGDAFVLIGIGVIGLSGVDRGALRDTHGPTAQCLGRRLSGRDQTLHLARRFTDNVAAPVRALCDGLQARRLSRSSFSVDS